MLAHGERNMANLAEPFNVHALTNSAALAAWLMPNDFIPEVGHRFQFRTAALPGFNGIIDCEVTLVEPLRRLAYTWQCGPLRRPTLVTWTLDAVPGGTHLRLEQAGFAGAGGWFVRVILRQRLRRAVLYVAALSYTGKVKRLRNSSRARVVPCDAKGAPLGEWREAEAVFVEGQAAEHAEALLNRKYGFQKRLIDAFGWLRLLAQR